MIIMTWGTSALSLFAKCVWGSSSRDNHYCYPAPALSWFRHLLTVVCGVALVAFVIMSKLMGEGGIKNNIAIANCMPFV